VPEERRASVISGASSPSPNGWHVSKSISVWHIIGTLMIAVGFFAYLSNIEKETVVNQMDIKSLSSRMDRSTARNSEQFGEIKDMLKSLSVKIDNLSLRRER
jgi:hypothetical protein